MSGKALAAGSLHLLTAIHPILRFQNVNHDLLQIIIRVNELNVSALRPELFRSELDFLLAAGHESRSL